MKETEVIPNFKDEVACTSQNSAGGIGTALWVGKRLENTGEWLENGPQDSTNSSRHPSWD
jgi:hypothetical protein